MKTLVIHPKDTSTDFLKPIYEDLDCTVISDPRISSGKLKQLIKSHDRIIMMGHGDGWGLFGSGRYVIDSGLVYLLREKDCVAIWCKADEFFLRYEIPGFYTGMIISEYEEALYFSIHEPNIKDITYSNELFAQSVAKAIKHQGDMMPSLIRESYKGDGNHIIDFNKQNLYYGPK